MRDDGAVSVEVVSVEQVAERLGCSRRRVFQLLADGTLDRAPRFGRSVRIYVASVDRALTPTPTARRQARRSRAGFSLADLRPELTA